MMKPLSYIGALCIIGLFFYLIFSNEDSARNFEFTYKVQLDPSDKNIELWIPVPQTNEVQTISNLNLGYKELDCRLETEEKHKNQYYYCYTNQLSEFTNVILTCDVSRKEHKSVKYNNVDPELYDAGTNNRTVPEGAVFQKIINEEGLNKDNVRDIYNYVLSGMHYGKPKAISSDDQYYGGKNKKTGQEWLPEAQRYGLKQVSKDEVVNAYIKAKNDKTDYTFGNGNSIYACDIGVGNCTDYHSYFMSLCRTLDIPARFHMGFNIPNKEGETEGPIGGYHCWADYYMQEEGWTPVDISESDKDPSKEDYFFGTLNKDRVEFVVGRDLKLKNRPSTENFFVYPIVEGTTYKKSFSYKNL